MSFSEKGFGARVENAQKLLDLLNTFKSFTPLDPSMETARLKELIGEVKKQNSIAVNAIQDYTLAVESRQQSYYKSPDSLHQLLSPITATVRSVYGKESKEFQVIADLANKIRGNKNRKLGKSADEDAISQSERSFGSMTQTLSDILDILSKYNYQPANSKIIIPRLEDLHAVLKETNTSVTTTFGKQKECRNDRQSKYDALHQITQRIKDAVKSQYGLKSTEYVLIKGFTI